MPSAPPIKNVTFLIALSFQFEKREARSGEVIALPFSSKMQTTEFLGIDFSRRMASAEIPLFVLSSTLLYSLVLNPIVVPVC